MFNYVTFFRIKKQKKLILKNKSLTLKEKNHIITLKKCIHFIELNVYI